MRILIKLKNNKTIETRITEEQYQELHKKIIDGKIKHISIGNRIIRTTAIEEIEPVAEPINKKFRLPEAGLRQAVDKEQLSSKLEGLWNSLKKNGMFNKFNSYEEYKKANYENS